MKSGAEIQALLDAVPDRRRGPDLAGTTRVVVEPGDYEVTETLVVRKCADLDLTGVSLYPAPGIDCLRVEAAWSTVRAPFIVGHPLPHTGIGIDVQAHHVTVRDAFVREMGTGLRLFGTAANNTNANCCTVDNATVFRPWSIGVHMKGGDCNAGTLDAIEVVGAAGKTLHGVLDESFLGNLARGLHVSSSTLEAVRITAAANYSTWDGCYLENNCGTDLLPGSPKIASVPGATWLGGNAIAHVTTGDRVGMGRSAVRFQGTTPGGHTLAVTIPHPTADSYLSLTHAAPQGATSGGTEMLLRRKSAGGLIEWVMRKAGATVAAWSATRGDHPDGFGLFRPGKDQP